MFTDNRLTCMHYHSDGRRSVENAEFVSFAIFSIGGHF